MAYVISKLANANTYTFYTKSAGGLPTIEKQITIDGKAGVMQKGLVTPGYSVTFVSDSDLELLKDHPVFKMHMENGFISIQKDRDEVKSEKTAENMKVKDASAQPTPKDLAKKGKKNPKNLSV